VRRATGWATAAACERAVGRRLRPVSDGAHAARQVGWGSLPSKLETWSHRSGVSSRLPAREGDGASYEASSAGAKADGSRACGCGTRHMFVRPMTSTFSLTYDARPSMHGA
jgi:hypothetical protein